MSIELIRTNGVATLLLNRPDKLNALSEEMYHGIAEHCIALDADDEMRAIVLTGAGRAFCAGGDVGSMGGYDVVTGRKRSQKHKRTVVNLYNVEKPLIAAVRGPAAGIGFSLALACDLIIASESAYFLAAFKKVGILPDGGAVFFLNQYLGIARAKEIAYTARKISAHEAKDMGLVMKVVPDERLELEARALAHELAASATYALRLAKRMFHSMYVPTLEMLLEMENLAVCGARLTEDHKEGIAAFREKRAPKFTGR